MAPPEDTVGDLGDIKSLLKNQNVAQVMQLLQFLGSPGSRKAALAAQLLGAQTERAQAQAAGFGPNAKYYPGFEPGGLMDSLVSAGNSGAFALGKADYLPEEERVLNRVPLGDLSSSLDEVMKAVNTISDSANDSTYNNLMDYVVKTLMPSATEGETSQPIAGGQPSGRGPSSYYDPTYGLPPGRIRNPAFDAPFGSGGVDSNAAQRAAAEQKFQQFRGGRSNPASDAASFASNFVGGLLSSLKPRGPGGPGGPTPRAEGGEDPGYQLIRVGERSPDDKKFATEEIILAPKGTVVAPVPRGMENPSPDEAMTLIEDQLTKSRKKGRSRIKSAQGGLTPPVGSAYQNYGSTALGRLQLGLSKFQNQRDFNQRQMEYFQNRDRRNYESDRDYGFNVWNAQNANKLGFARQTDESQAARNNFNLGNRRLSIEEKGQASEAADRTAELALRRELGMRGLDIDQQRANQDFQLASAAQAFQNLMAGIVGSSMPGVRRGATPNTGLFG